MKKLIKIITVFLLTACSKTNDDAIVINQSLATYTSGEEIDTGAVIACAASAPDSNAVLIFFYPENGASNIQLFETQTISEDQTNYNNYKKITLESVPFFNGYLGKYTLLAAQEKWLIVTYELEGEIKLSNPIRSKQVSKPTVWNDAVIIETTLMPTFQWEDNAFGDNGIYFQVVSNMQNDLLSGTYTDENQFQYYNLSNVILNITTQPPPELQINTTYKFTLMDVSIDNWVNLVSQKEFHL